MLLPIVCLILGFILPEYQLELLATGMLYGLFAASVDLSYGYTGILNLGSALYFGLGAYTMAIGLTNGWNLIILLVISLVISCFVSGIIGYIGFRVRTSVIHFGLIGLALTLGFEQLAISFYDLTGGTNGIVNIPRPVFQLFGLEIPLQSSFSYYLFTVIVTCLLFYLLWRLVHSEFGKVAKALRHDETKLETMGYNPLRLKMTVNMITASVSSIAGALFVPIIGIAYPSLFGVVISMSVLIWVSLGGTGTLLGPFVIAIVLKLGESVLSSSFADLYLLMIGVLFILVVIVAPQGLLGIIRSFVFKQTGKGKSEVPVK